MTTCAAGHASEGTDFCDECGLRIGAPVPVGPAGAVACVVCSEPLAGTFCENCGHDRTQPPPERWTATVRADAVWFDEVCRSGRADARSLVFPHDRPERRVELSGAVLAIGRCSGGRSPDIDLGEATGDLAVSVRHGELRSGSDGSWDVVDLGSTNGTRLASATRTTPIVPNVPVRLAHGDRLLLGAWTTITVRDRSGS